MALAASYRSTQYTVEMMRPSCCKVQVLSDVPGLQDSKEGLSYVPDRQ